ncbi:MAG: metal-dependent hydrolase [Pseudomonadota bacterium]|nr:metal-dependent hydrolase [Pseudomonadota bacterium]
MLFPEDGISWKLVLLGAICAVIPDLDVIGFTFGVRYGAVWGHRGLTHSIVFAGLLAAVTTAFWVQGVPGLHFSVFLFLFLSTLSHPILDACTDGGLGVAFFAPFRVKRYFFPKRPIAVPPIGIAAFFSARGWQVMKSEFRWIWLPAMVLIALGHVLKAGPSGL